MEVLRECEGAVGLRTILFVSEVREGEEVTGGPGPTRCG